MLNSAQQNGKKKGYASVKEENVIELDFDKPNFERIQSYVLRSFSLKRQLVYLFRKFFTKAFRFNF